MCCGYLVTLWTVSIVFSEQIFSVLIKLILKFSDDDNLLYFTFKQFIIVLASNGKDSDTH